jgi:DNA-binding response OmpR family regulator
MATILVVEPDRNQRLLVEEELREQGHDVRTVATAEEALARVTGEGFDLLVLEIATADAAGLRLFRRVFAVCPQLPVIIHTAYADSVGGLLTSLADAWVLKTSDFSELLAAVERVLRRTALFATPWRGVEPFCGEDYAPGASQPVACPA